jgi:hypothetical protein
VQHYPDHLRFTRLPALYGSAMRHASNDREPARGDTVIG